MVRGTAKRRSKARADRSAQKDWIKRIALWVMALTAVGTLAFALILAYFLHSLPPVETIAFPRLEQSSMIYANDGSELGRAYAENRIPLEYSQMPALVKLASIAAEDQRFFSHKGIDTRGILRALLANLKSGRLRGQGGSTITQQLVRGVFLSRERTFSRKIREMLYAIQVERKYDKERILELYLNQIFFGNNSYGVEAAAKTYFGKDVSDLKLEEIALLAGLPRGPAVYDPYKYPKKALARRQYVLGQMHELGYIADDAYQQAEKAPLKLAPKRPSLYGGTIAPYFVSAVVDDLKDTYGEGDLLQGKLRVVTPLDKDLQGYANDAITQGLARAKAMKQNASQAALLALDANTGHVLAMVGGDNYLTSPYNRAYQSKRHAGSTFKPFVYLTALMQGYTPDLVLVDEPTTFWVGVNDRQVYSPKNYDGLNRGEITLADALKMSINVIAVKLNDIVGPENVVPVMRAAGIESPVEPVLSLPLGTSDVSLMELTRAFCTFGKMGVRITPIMILKVRDQNGDVLEENKPVSEQVLPADQVYTLVTLMKRVIDEEGGTGQGARIAVPAAGKTGTTSDFRDAWFVGFTPRLCVGVWFGNDDNTFMNKMTGGSTPAYTWRLFMEQAVKKYPSGDFEAPAGTNSYTLTTTRSSP